jgi:hypothetical protein
MPGAGSVQPQSLGKPPARFPGAIATDSDLAISVDRQQTALALTLDAVSTSMTVADASIITPYNLLTIDSEIVKVTGAPSGNLVPVQRGFDGSVAALHLPGALVSGFVDAWHHNTLVAEIEAIENALGTNLSKIPASWIVAAPPYNFTPQTTGGTLNVGTNSITLTPVPLGVNGADTNHYLRISGGTGAPEAVLITGGNAVSGAASGTIFVTCANAHSGAWTIQSATSGIQEAIVFQPGGGMVFLPPGIYDTYADIYIDRGIQIFGASRGSVTVRSNSPTQNIFNVSVNSPVKLCGFLLNAATTRTAGAGIVLGGGSLGCEISDVTFIGQFNNVSVTNSVAWNIHDTYSAGNIANGLVINNSGADSGDSSFHTNVWDGSGATGAGILWSSGGGLRITDNKFLGYLWGIDANAAAAGVATSDFIIANNSMESGATANGAIRIRVTGSGSNISNVQISNNQITYAGPCIQVIAPAQQVIINDNLLQSVGANVTVVIVSANLSQIQGNRIGSGASGAVGIDTTGQPGAAIVAYAKDNFMLNLTTPYKANNLTVVNDVLAGVTFANLGPWAVGSMVYVIDGTPANPVAGGGSGCFAKRLAGVWVGN